MMEALNRYFINANIQFITCDYEIIYDNNLNDFNTSKEYLLPNKQNTINIYYVSNLQNASGYTYLPSHYTSFMLIDKNVLLETGNKYVLMLHEMGHYFGLHHTHGKKNVACGTDEFVSRNHRISTIPSCLLYGDDLCDTPADPGLYFECVLGRAVKCVSTVQDLVNQKDAFGVSYTPDFGNIMSYNNRSCREHFTPGQYSKMFSYSRIKPRAYERFIPSNWAIRSMDALNILNNKVYIVVPFARWMDAPKYYHSEGIVVSNSVIDNSQGIHLSQPLIVQ